MTCQCTCGKHMLIDLSKAITAQNPYANAAAGGPMVTFRDDTGAGMNVGSVDYGTNTNAAAGTMPTGWRVEP